MDTIVTLRHAGFKGFLIGENFMKHASPSIAFADFINELKAKCKMRVKVCGITQVRQAIEICEAGADFGGFIFYPPSPRYVYKSMSAAQNKKICAALTK